MDLRAQFANYWWCDSWVSELDGTRLACKTPCQVTGDAVLTALGTWCASCIEVESCWTLSTLSGSGACDTILNSISTSHTVSIWIKIILIRRTVALIVSCDQTLSTPWTGCRIFANRASRIARRTGSCWTGHIKSSHAECTCWWWWTCLTVCYSIGTCYTIAIGIKVGLIGSTETLSWRYD